MAEDCLPPELYERLLWRKQTLRFDFSGSANDLSGPPEIGGQRVFKRYSATA